MAPVRWCRPKKSGAAKRLLLNRLVNKLIANRLPDKVPAVSRGGCPTRCLQSRAAQLSDKVPAVSRSKVPAVSRAGGKEVSIMKDSPYILWRVRVGLLLAPLFQRTRCTPPQNVYPTTMFRSLRRHRRHQFHHRECSMTSDSWLSTVGAAAPASLFGRWPFIADSGQLHSPLLRYAVVSWRILASPRGRPWVVVRRPYQNIPGTLNR